MAIATHAIRSETELRSRKLIFHQRQIGIQVIVMFLKKQLVTIRIQLFRDPIRNWNYHLLVLA